MATLPLAERPTGQTESATGAGEFRPSAAFPLPRLRPVADFVALPSVKRYVTVQGKFSLALGGAAAWLLIVVVGAISVASGVAAVVTWPVAILLVLTVVAVPGFVLMFSLLGFLLDQPPSPKVAHPVVPATVVITARNQPRSVVTSLAYLRAQDYDGPLSVLLVDHDSTDATIDEARRAADQLGMALRVVVERRPSEIHARNTGFACADTPLAVLIDAGTVLHPSTVRLLVARLLRSPSDTAAVSAHVLVRNTRHGDLEEVEAHDYSLSVHASQRVHGLFQAPLVAEGSCALYRTDAVRAISGWSLDDTDGVMLTWRFLERGWRVFHEPLAVAFTTEPVDARSWAARRVRAAWSILEGMRHQGLHSLRFPFTRFVALVDVAAPLVDATFAGGMLVALALALLGTPTVLVVYLVAVLPISVVTAVAVRRAVGSAMDDLGLWGPRGVRSWLGLALGLHAVQAPLGAWEAVAHLAGRKA